MLISTNGQDVIFLMTLLGGCGIGFLYDLYDLLRRFACPIRFLLALYDLLFWLFAAGIALWVILLSANGVIRVYMFVGFGLGALLYLGGLRHLFHVVGRWALRQICRLRAELRDIRYDTKK